jgi:hypothetical protein
MVPQLKKDLTQVGAKEVIPEILGTEGVQKYPPDGNAPPTPYYRRGIGMQYKTYNDNSSERYGSQWGKPKVSGYKSTTTNTASYAQYLVGDNQARHMAKKGWKKIISVVKEKVLVIGAILGKQASKTIRRIGL